MKTGGVDNGEVVGPVEAGLVAVGPRGVVVEKVVVVKGVVVAVVVRTVAVAEERTAVVGTLAETELGAAGPVAMGATASAVGAAVGVTTRRRTLKVTFVSLRSLIVYVVITLLAISVFMPTEVDDVLEG